MKKYQWCIEVHLIEDITGEQHQKIDKIINDAKKAIDEILVIE